MSLSDSTIMYLQFLGTFQIHVNGQDVCLKSGNTTKVMQILQLLLLHSPDGISRDALLDQIFGYDDLLNPVNNLKASISQLRRQLQESMLGDGTYIRFVDGTYRWCGSMPLQIDVYLFEQALKHAKAAWGWEEKVRRYQNAVSLYTGNFLPQLAGVDWAMKLDAYYRNLYAQAMHTLTDLLKEEARYADILPLTEQAYRLLRTDEWQVMRIEALMQLGKWEEAKQVYKDTVSALAKEFDLPPTEDLIQHYRLISEKTQNAVSSFDEMLVNVQESNAPGGAYFCAFPGFIDSCRIMSRCMARSGSSCFLMLCSLGNRKELPIQDEQRLIEASDNLRSAIQKSLRHSDFFTQYNASQFLIFLVGTCKENCSLVAQRIEQNFQQTPVRGTRLYFEINSAVFLDSNLGKQFQVPPSWA